jgi:hypothetical protein
MSKKIFIIIASLLVAVAIVAGVAYLVISQTAVSQEAKAKENAQLFVEGLVDNNADAAYALLTKEAQGTITQAAFKEKYSQAALTDPSYISDTIVKLEGDSYGVARVVGGYPPNSDGSNEITYRVVVVKEGDKWKVSSLGFGGTDTEVDQ